MKNTTGIYPAYRRFLADMAIALGQVLNFEKCPIGTTVSVNKRGFCNPDYLEADAIDVIEWLMSVSPSWKICEVSHDDTNAKHEIETLNSCNYITAAMHFKFAKKLASLLQTASTTTIISVEDSDEDEEDTTGRRILIQMIHSGGEKALIFYTDIDKDLDFSKGPETVNDLLVFVGTGSVTHVFDPLTLAYNKNLLTDCGEVWREVDGIQAMCSPLYIKAKSAASVIPVTQAIKTLQDIVANNAKEYNFPLSAQTMLFGEISSIIWETIDKAQHESFPFNQSFRINLLWNFIDEECNAGADYINCTVNVILESGEGDDKLSYQNQFN